MDSSFADPREWGAGHTSGLDQAVRDLFSGAGELSLPSEVLIKYFAEFPRCLKEDPERQKLDTSPWLIHGRADTPERGKSFGVGGKRRREEQSI